MSPVASYNISTPNNNSTTAHPFPVDHPHGNGNNLSFIPSPPVVSAAYTSPNKPFPNQSPSKNSYKNQDLLLPLIGAFIGFTVVLLFISLFWLTMKLRRKKQVFSNEGLSIQKGGNFSFEQLSKATNGFSTDRILGEGGFGVVYKGVLPHENKVAIKRLKPNTSQGDSEFHAEVNTITTVHHCHLVSVFGFCIHEAERLIVYEYVPNSTLEHYLHGTNGCTLDWSTRFRVVKESARGLAYLHEDSNPQIMHRDVKPANILMGESFQVKLSDFGLTKFNFDNNTHVSTLVKGTPGYVAPDYIRTQKLTAKSDVYSFGVVLLEIMTGKGPLHVTNDTDKTYVDWARDILNQRLEESGDFQDLVDPMLNGRFDNRDISRLVVCIVSCIHNSANKRPKMSDIVKALEEDVTLEELKNRMIRSRSNSYNTLEAIMDFLNFRNMVMSSQTSTTVSTQVQGGIIRT